MSIEAMKLTRQLLWRYRHETPIGNQPHMICQEVDEAFEKIDQAIEQAQHQLKPRCFADFQPNHEIDRKCQWCAVQTECQAIEQAQKQEPVYTSPPPQHALMAEHWKEQYDRLKAQRPAAEGEDTRKAWVGLTPQERDEINEQVYGAVPHHVAFHHAIEAKLKEKNT